MHASLELLNEIGVESIAKELLRKRAWLVPALQEKGWTVLHADVAESNQGGMIAICRPGEDLKALHAKLEEAQIMTSLRFDREGNQYLRLSPHFYNTDEELNRALELL